MRHALMSLSAAGLLALTACSTQTTESTTEETEVVAPEDLGASEEQVDEVTEEQPPAGDAAEEAEVVVDTCAVADPGVVAGLTVSNDQVDPRSYVVTVAFVGADGTPLGEAQATADDVRSGQSVEAQAVAEVADPPAEVTCEVTDVNRF
ncbi:FxLYD domain-containing protein [Kineococcus arenarius]|uniref:FxLYD domain-containing protein n=1 Tax=unclassified Kineococcus TaxID=2621656 RepID=UPI003D7CECC5